MGQVTKQWMLIHPSFRRTRLVHAAYGPRVMINSAPFTLKGTSICTTDDLVTLETTWRMKFVVAKPLMRNLRVKQCNHAFAFHRNFHGD